jgi:hypothetical protein
LHQWRNSAQCHHLEKAMLTLVLNFKGIILQQCLPQNETVNCEWSALSTALWHAVWKKSGTKLRTRQWFLLQDSAQVVMPALKTAVSGTSTCMVSKDNLPHVWEAGGTLKKSASSNGHYFWKDNYIKGSGNLRYRTV